MGHQDSEQTVKHLHTLHTHTQQSLCVPTPPPPSHILTITQYHIPETLAPIVMCSIAQSENPVVPHSLHSTQPHPLYIHHITSSLPACPDFSDLEIQLGEEEVREGIQ